ncbi:unnamed protein product [Cylindrotheca closterium]|uniref:Casein kinase I n=1 Tax=Cylindrotheca closterium TaxID=2856 RepID=A0AAD2CNX0_9STRA|nr:unnamed protein product [Cylindrotheca closterium]
MSQVAVSSMGISPSEDVEGGGGITSNNNTPYGTAADLDVARKEKKSSTGNNASSNSNLPFYGRQEIVKATGNFPALASNKTRRPQRMVAAKVEVGEFKNSGVLLGEASILHFLDSCLPENTVPVYMGHLKANEDISAIVMEYLPGQDMHFIREKTTKKRRLNIADSVFLTASIILPLLQRMHEVGMVHRDVKPSNCVKRGVKQFCMVDFGLSKSVVVQKDSPASDLENPWKGKGWIRPANQSGQGYYRKERPTADFRGTSMYASLRVHQLKDYCARDDIWSLLYVFCDLVSGGLPWMQHAANRDREACQKLKERIHGEEEGRPDETKRLLMGNEYHVALFNKYRGGIDPPEGVLDLSDLPEPLALSKDEKKVSLLRNAFDHLKSLSYYDMPDYSLIKECLEGFLDENAQEQCTGLATIQWEQLHQQSKERKRKGRPLLGTGVPTWEFGLSGENNSNGSNGNGDKMSEIDDHSEDNNYYCWDPVNADTFMEAEANAASELPDENSAKSEGDFVRLPLELRFRIAQMEYNMLHHKKIPPHLALRDWLKVALPVLYGEWDSKTFEKGGHRTSTDGYRRETYLQVIDKCLKCADKFSRFRQLACVYQKEDKGTDAPRSRKRRRIISTMLEPKTDSLGSDLLAIAMASFRLRHAKRLEQRKAYAPPPRLQFGSSSGF